MRMMTILLLACALTGCNVLSDDTKQKLDVAVNQAANEVLDAAMEKSAVYVADAATVVRDKADKVANIAAAKAKEQASKAIDSVAESVKDEVHKTIGKDSSGTVRR